MSTSLNERFGGLRSVVHGLRGEPRWQAVVRQLEGWTAQEIKELALPYLSDALKDNAYVREAPKGWFELEHNRITVHPAWPLVSSLDLSGWELGDKEVKVIARSKALRQITRLDLSDVGIGDKGLKALAQSKNLRRLSELNLHQNKIGVKGVEALAQSQLLSQLTSLRLSYNKVKDKGLKALAHAKTLSQLKTLVLYHNKIGDEGIKALAQSEALSQLTSLNLNLNRVGVEGIKGQRRWRAPRLWCSWTSSGYLATRSRIRG